MDEGALVGTLLETAYFAARKHRDQRRKDAYKTPYINHPLGVAYILWKVGDVTDLSTLQVLALHYFLEGNRDIPILASHGVELCTIN